MTEIDLQRRIDRFGFGHIKAVIEDERGAECAHDVYIDRRGIRMRPLIVFGPKFLELVPQPHLDAVIAHEIGHHECLHQLWIIVHRALGWLGVFFLGMATPHHHILFLFNLIYAILWFFPIQAFLARLFELQADAFGARMVGTEPMRSALIWIRRAVPRYESPWWDFTNHHPSLNFRINFL
jgi:Zn-dependent protease with chaperone function